MIVFLLSAIEGVLKGSDYSTHVEGE